MISVIYFGRNDNHGYNLAKRVALCLNTTASLLTHPTDEIVFVDYNTPDPLPTFPELLADTLTEQAKARLRVLRVRPHQHAAYARRSPLPVIGVLAINAGIRRTQPENRWVLISSTDMILVPHDVDASLSGICAGLDLGIHQLPRFELPEFVWETLDRKDPAAARRAIQRYGRTLHLDEITPTEPPVLYDNPGDFQLVARADLFEIDGLDERMIVGWNHPDSNLARRLKLLGREDRPLTASLAGYHCAHTITLNVTNQARRLENDEAIFVHTVDTPTVPTQRNSWGLAEQELEEISLTRSRAGLAIAGLEAALAPALAEPTTGGRRHADFNRAGYPAQHVAPYLANLLTFAPRGSTIGWLGPKGQLHAVIARWMDGLEGGARLVDLDDEAAPTESMRWVIVNLGRADAGNSDAADRLHELPLDEQAPVWRAFARFVALAHLEQAAERDTGRQYIVLNAIHTVFEPAVTELLDVAMTPHTMRLRAGPVRRAAPSSIYAALAGVVRHALQHRDEAPATEVSRAFGEALILAVDPAAGIEGNIANLALLQSTAFQRMLELDTTDRAAQAEDSRPARRLAERLSLPLSALIPADQPPSLCKLTAAEDWEDPGWRRWAELFGHDSYDYFRRDREIWIRAQLLYGIEQLGLLDASKSIAVIAARADDFYLRLAQANGSLTVFSVSDQDADQTWRSRPIGAPPLGQPLKPLAEASGQRFDAVIVPPGSALSRVVEYAKLIAPGGHLGLAVEVALGRDAANAWVPVHSLQEDALARRFDLTSAAPFDARLTALTVDRVLPRASASRPHLMLDSDGELIAWAAWFGRR